MVAAQGQPARAGWDRASDGSKRTDGTPRRGFMMSETIILGFLAALCSTAAFVPQVVKTWRTRSTRDISLGTFSTIVFGAVLWMVYAWLQRDLPVFATNGVIFVLASIILGLKLRHG